MLPCDRHLDQSSELSQLPRWITKDTRLILNVDDARCKGFLLLDADGNWTFIQRDNPGRTTYHHDINDLSTTWRQRMLDSSLKLSWQQRAWAYHVSAKGLLQGAPNSLSSPCAKNTTIALCG
jgi:hypothetical protein